MVQLRDYQLDAVERIRIAIRQGHRKILVVSPTGSGKTVIGTHIMDNTAKNRKSSIWVAPRREIIHQTSRKLDDFGARHSILMAGHKQNEFADITLASIQTYHRRKTTKGFKQPNGNVVIFDEAHLSLANSWQEMAGDYPGAILIGLTATPCRSDGAGLGSFWDILIEVTTVEWLMLQGWLVRANFWAPSIPDLTGVHTRKGDYVEEELGQIMGKTELIGNVVDDWAARASNRPTVVFTPTVANSIAYAEAFRAAGYAAEHLDGKTPKDERDAILDRLDRGQTQIVCNCQVLQEGWDQPKVSCLVLARPTKSYGLYLQQVGRVLRPHPESGKENALVIDHAGNVYRHGFPEEAGNWDLDDTVKITTKRDERRKAEDRVQTCRHCFATFKGHRCPACGTELTRKAQDLNMKEGRLSPVKKGKKKPSTTSEKQKIWLECLFKASHRSLKVGAAAHMYRKRVGTWPGHNLKRVPRSEQWQMFAKDFIEITRVEAA